MPAIVEIVAIWFVASFPLGMVVGKILSSRVPTDPLGILVPAEELSQVDLRPLSWLGSCMLVTSEESAQR